MVRNMYRKIPVYMALFLILVTLTVAVREARTQTEFPRRAGTGAPVFLAEAVVFRATDGEQGQIEVYYKVHNPSLTYVRRGEEYFANYEIDAILRGRDNPQVASATLSESYSVSTYRDTRNPANYLVNKLELFAPQGNYKLELKLTDRISQQMYALTLEVKVPRYTDSNYKLSSPLFCSVIPEATVPEKFVKYGYALLPQITHTYGGKQPGVSIYLEAYSPADTTVELSVIMRAAHRKQDFSFADTARFFPEPNGRTPVMMTIPFDNFVPGECKLSLKFIDPQGKVVDKVEQIFRVSWSLGAMIENDWETVVDQLIHVTTHKDLKALREAPKEKRVEAFAAFWKAKDPTPDTPENEWKTEYYRRIIFSDENFTTPYRPGWQTDFGMVYIKYGEPDQVERYPFEMGRKPYEIWHYYAQARRFVFVDTQGNDDYKLQYPYDGLNR